MIQNNPLEQRASNERRTSIQGTQFPVITRHGVCVRHDRRWQPDRRISKIKVDENFLKKDAFERLFAKFTVEN